LREIPMAFFYDYFKKLNCYKRANLEERDPSSNCPAKQVVVV
jgi:hypothetical protein